MTVTVRFILIFVILVFVKMFQVQLLIAYFLLFTCLEVRTSKYNIAKAGKKPGDILVYVCMVVYSVLSLCFHSVLEDLKSKKIRELCKLSE